MNVKRKKIFKVSFMEPPLEGSTQRDFYFASLKSIYDVFTKDAIGCSVGNLWNLGVSKGARYVSRKCTIENTELVSHVRE